MFNHVCFIENFLSKEECLSLRNQDNWENGLVGSNESNLNIRNSKVSWITIFNNPEIYLKVVNAFNEANNYTYEYTISTVEDLQLTLYNGSDDGFYGVHQDSFNSQVGDTFDRKLSMSVLLSEPSEYAGGELIINSKAKGLINVQKKIGSAAIFPSYLEHEVKKVTNGKRFSLVAWARGPMFK